MDNDVYKEEMEFYGCIEFFHPTRPGFFHVIEQKLRGSGFVNLRDGAFAFFISPNLTLAEQSILHSHSQVLAYIERIMNDDGYVPNLHDESNDDLLTIPKTDFVKWQISPRIRHVIEQ